MHLFTVSSAASSAAGDRPAQVHHFIILCLPFFPMVIFSPGAAKRRLSVTLLDSSWVPKACSTGFTSCTTSPFLQHQSPGLLCCHCQVQPAPPPLATASQFPEVSASAAVFALAWCQQPMQAYLGCLCCPCQSSPQLPSNPPLYSPAAAAPLLPPIAPTPAPACDDEPCPSHAAKQPCNIGTHATTQVALYLSIKCPC